MNTVVVKKPQNGHSSCFSTSHQTAHKVQRAFRVTGRKRAARRRAQAAPLRGGVQPPAPCLIKCKGFWFYFISLVLLQLPVRSSDTYTCWRLKCRAARTLQPAERTVLPRCTHPTAPSCPHVQPWPVPWGSSKTGVTREALFFYAFRLFFRLKSQGLSDLAQAKSPPL